MRTKYTGYEVQGGKLFVNGDAIPLRTGVIYLALARAGWKGYEGPLSAELVENVLQLDRRISLFALAREIESSAA